jgi:hypothetical protein
MKEYYRAECNYGLDDNVISEDKDVQRLLEGFMLIPDSNVRVVFFEFDTKTRVLSSSYSGNEEIPLASQVSFRVPKNQTPTDVISQHYYFTGYEITKSSYDELENERFSDAL